MSRFGYCINCEFCKTLSTPGNSPGEEPKSKCEISGNEFFALAESGFGHASSGNRKCTLTFKQRKEAEKLYPRFEE